MSTESEVRTTISDNRCVYVLAVKLSREWMRDHGTNRNIELLHNEMKRNLFSTVWYPRLGHEEFCTPHLELRETFHPVPELKEVDDGWEYTLTVEYDRSLCKDLEDYT